MMSRKRVFDDIDLSSNSDDELTSSDERSKEGPWHMPFSQMKQFKAGRRFCSHCHELVSLKTYKAHRRIYYNEVSVYQRHLYSLHFCVSAKLDLYNNVHILYNKSVFNPESEKIN